MMELCVMKHLMQAWLMTGQLDWRIQGTPRIILVHTASAMYQSVIGNIQDSISSYCNSPLIP